MSEAIHEALCRRTGSAHRKVDENNATLAANRAIHDSLDGVLPEGALIRGNVLRDALRTINGQRQDSYGNPEDSFERIANLWDAYLTGKYRSEIDLTAEDVALMMTLMKIARMMTGSGHRDSYIDAAGYIGLAADMGAK